MFNSKKKRIKKSGFIRVSSGEFGLTYRSTDDVSDFVYFLRRVKPRALHTRKFWTLNFLCRCYIFVVIALISRFIKTTNITNVIYTWRMFRRGIFVKKIIYRLVLYSAVLVNEL